MINCLFTLILTAPCLPPLQEANTEARYSTFQKTLPEDVQKIESNGELRKRFLDNGNPHSFAASLLRSGERKENVLGTLYLSYFPNKDTDKNLLDFLIENCESRDFSTLMKNFKFTPGKLDLNPSDLSTISSNYEIVLLHRITTSKAKPYNPLFQALARSPGEDARDMLISFGASSYKEGDYEYNYGVRRAAILALLDWQKQFGDKSQGSSR